MFLIDRQLSQLQLDCEQLRVKLSQQLAESEDRERRLREATHEEVRAPVATTPRTGSICLIL